MEIKIVKNVLEENDKLADQVRKNLRANKQSLFNFMSSPGSGKTTLLEKLIPALQDRGYRVAVIEGDITTANDAERLQPLNVPIALINTDAWGGDCHLGSNVILGAMDQLSDREVDIFLIENVGNLVCPAEFDTGADHNVVVLSVTEGEDKPLKYPLMFRVSSLACINKVEIAEILEANVPLIRENILKMQSEMTILETSGKKGIGVDDVASWIAEKHTGLGGKKA